MGRDSVSPLTAGDALRAWTIDVPVLVGVLGCRGPCTWPAFGGVRRSGGAWPVWRTLVFFAAGLGSVVVLTMSFLRTYDRVLFWL